jgi:nitrogenase-associated protein
MPHVIFYEKPGCANNARQKQLLEAAGHALEVHNLLAEAWTAERLRSFFGDAAVFDWFNKAAPKIKSGEIDPRTIDADSALALMLADPILIRRPLMEVEGRRGIGFDPVAVDAWIGLQALKSPTADLETCRRNPEAQTSDDHVREGAQQ